MAFVFWLLAALVPCLIGKGALRVLYRGQALQELNLADCMLTGGMICIGLAEAAHLGAVVLGWSFSRCVVLFGGAVGIAALLAVVVLLADLFRGRKKRGAGENPTHGEKQKRHLKEKGPASNQFGFLPLGIFVLLVLAQLFVILKGQGIYLDGDLTLETVASFLETDAIYEINPMTGRPYALGIPSRLQILCLPTLYGALCRMFALETATLVTVMIPVLVLAGCYLAYSTVAKYFFPREPWKRGVFLALTALLMGAGDYLYGMEGFGVLHAGFRGVTIRGAVLLPYLFGLLLRKKYKLVLLCILAEACMVWTFYGVGACAAVTVGMLVVGAVYRRVKARKAGNIDVTGKEADYVGTPE